MRCRQCGAQVEQGERFCAECGTDVSRRVCPRCSAALDASKRFCTQCGTNLDTGAAPSSPPIGSGGERLVGGPAASGVSSGGGCLGGCLTVLLGILLVVIVIGAAGAYYVLAPDLPPFRLPNVPLLSAAPATLAPEDEPVEPDPTVEVALARLGSGGDSGSDAAPQDTTRIKALLEQGGVPVEIVAREKLENGERVLLIAVRKQSDSSGAGLNEGYEALLDIAEVRELRLAGFEHLVVAVRDEQGRVLFGVAAPVSAIEQYRGGAIGMADLIGAAGAQAESRGGILEAILKGQGAL